MRRPEWLENMWEFLTDAGGWGVASVTAALVFFVIGLWEHSRDKSVPAFWFVCLTVLLFWLGAYAAWYKKHRAVVALEKNKELPKLFLRYDPSHDTSIEYSGFFVQVEGEKNAFEVKINSEAVVGQNHKRIEMQWEVPAVPIGTSPIPIRASCVYYQGSTPHLFSASSRQIHKFFEQKKDFPNELEVAMTFKNVDGQLCPVRNLRITSSRDFRGNFEIACIPVQACPNPNQ